MHNVFFHENEMIGVRACALFGSLVVKIRIGGERWNEKAYEYKKLLLVSGHIDVGIYGISI